MGHSIPLARIASGNVIKDVTVAAIFLVQCILERFGNVLQRIRHPHKPGLTATHV